VRITLSSGLLYLSLVSMTAYAQPPRATAIEPTSKPVTATSKPATSKPTSPPPKTTISKSAAGPQRRVTLAQALKMALASNPSVAIFDARVKKAAAELRRSWSAYKPQLTASLSYARNIPDARLDFSEFIPPGFTVPDPITVVQKDTFTLKAGLTQTVFDGAAAMSIGVARKQVGAAALERKRGRLDFLIDVARAYYSVLLLEQDRRSLAEKIKVDARNQKVAAARVEAGQRPRVDVLQAALELTRTRQALITNGHRLAAARRQLAILIGVKGLVQVQRPPVLVAPKNALSRRAIKAAMRRRGDVKAARLAVLAAEQQRRAGWWSFVPTLSASVGYRLQNFDGFAGQGDAWVLGATLDVPLYLGGIRYASIAAAKAQVADVSAKERALRQKIESEIVRLSAELAAAESGLVTAKKALALAKTVVGDMAARYEAGTATQVEVLSANQRQLESELTLNRAQLSRDLLRLQLTHALGRFRAPRR
jgi:outer membrane protein